MFKQRTTTTLLLIVFFQALVIAQNPYFGVKAGANFSRMVLKDNDGTQTKFFNFSPGFNVGLTMDYRIIPELTVNASLLLSSKGYSERRVEDFQGVSVKSLEAAQLFYIDLPIYAKHEFDLGVIDLFAGAGGFVSYGYWGKYRWRREAEGESEWGKQDINWGSDPDLHDFKNLDYGVSLNGGVKFDQFVLDFGYNFSLANIAANDDNGQEARNRVIYVSLNYFFSSFYKYAEGNF